MLKIRELTKTYPGGVQALQGISLEILPGMFGAVSELNVRPVTVLETRTMRRSSRAQLPRLPDFQLMPLAGGQP
jgi:hypothetical protein